MNEEKTTALSAVTYLCLDYFKADTALCFSQLVLECKLRGITFQKTKFNLAVSKLHHEAVLEVREIIISPPKDKTYYKRNSFGGRLCHDRRNCPHSCMTNNCKPSHFLCCLQHLTGEGNEDDIICNIFLQHLPSAYPADLAAVGEDAPIEKLAKIADNVTDLTSGCTASVSSVQTQ